MTKIRSSFILCAGFLITLTSCSNYNHPDHMQNKNMSRHHYAANKKQDFTSGRLPHMEEDSFNNMDRQVWIREKNGVPLNNS